MLLGGREYNDSGSPRYGSYLRGRDAIATLFPTNDAAGHPNDYNGATTMFSRVVGMNNANGVNIPVTSDAGVRTNFGGSIQMLNPGGRTLVGVEGVTPGAAAGVVTQGEGDIDLVAPLGTIDAGEAGIRVSGNVNFAALAIVNAANVQVQGKSTGLPVIAAVNVGALTNASATAAQAATAAQDAMARDRAAQRQNAPSIFSIRMLGGGSDTPAPNADQKGASLAPQARASYDPSSAFQLVGNGELTEAQKMQLTREEKAHL